jgi:hypothetical protein
MRTMPSELKLFIFDEVRAKFPEYTDCDDHDLDLKIFNAPSTVRLRPFGLTLLKELYDCYEFDLDEHLSGKELLALKNYVGFPYFLPTNQKRIYIFSSRNAFLLKLRGGDVKEWLQSLIEKKKSAN